MRYFPIFLDLQGRRVLVLGTGEIAHRKAAALERAGAEITLRDRFEDHLLDGCTLAIGADAPEAELAALSRAAQTRGIPVNVVDRPALCSFISPAIVDRDPVTIAISTGGSAPVLARLLRARIEALLPPAFGRLAALAGTFSARMRAAISDTAQRRHVLERALTGRVADLVFAGDEVGASAALEAEIAAGAEAPRRGMVFLVGAGPGAADLLTLRAQRLLGEADVIVHDRLVSADVLDIARRDAERIHVGKARANHCMAQADINALLVRLAQEGRKVVRLKGGDPLIFGRGGEEIAALDAAGVDWEVVPGITAALACAAQFGIPLTHRATGRTLVLATGHARDGVADFDIPAIAGKDATLAIYMATAVLAELCDQLLRQGFDPSTPAAIVFRGGTPAAKMVIDTLQRLPDLVASLDDPGPGLVLIGPGVGLSARRPTLPYSRLPVGTAKSLRAF